MNRNDTSLPFVKTSREWIDFFEMNAARQRPIPWATGAGVMPAELQRFAKSLRGWQLGETSDGTHLLAAARNYAEAIGDPEFVDAVRLFIREEQRHGENLGRFLDLAGVTRATADWGDTLFRKLRYARPRMEIWAMPVVMVETHAMIYYNALRQASSSPVLQRICEQILADEVAHIHFQCERLAILHRHRGPLLRGITMALHRLLFLGITLAVWSGHRRAFRAGGYTFPRFWRAAWSKMGFAWRTMKPTAYQWRPRSDSQALPAFDC